MTPAKVAPATVRMLKGEAGPIGPQGREGAAGRDGTDGASGEAGSDGLPGAEGAGAASLFGDGSDGDGTVSSADTLTRDMYFEDLAIAPGAVLKTGGFRIFVRETLTLGDQAVISRDGNNGVSTQEGAALTGGTLGGSTSGGSVNTSACEAPDVSNSLGGRGAFDPTLSPGSGVVSLPPEGEGGAAIFRSAHAAISGRTLKGDRVMGGSGGAGSAPCNAGGGSGGGVVVVAARRVSVTGTARLSVRGGNGTHTTGSSGGGGGGVIAVVTTVPKPAGLTLDVRGGTSGPTASAPAPGRALWLE